MALKATIFKVQINIADMDRHYYSDHTLTIARHPSENDERMMVRLLAFALNADESLKFTRGLSTVDEPDLWARNDTGDIKLWIELGQPDEKRLRKACALSHRVIIYSYQPRTAQQWWQQLEKKVNELDKLSVFNLPEDCASQLARLTARNMQLQCNIQDGEVWLGNNEQSVTITPQRWK